MAEESPLRYRWRDAVLSKHGPPSRCRLVLVALSTYGNDDGTNWYPSAGQLAERTGLSRRAVEENIRIAETEGWIRRTQRGGGRGWRCTVYTPLLPAGVGKILPHVAERAEDPSAPQPTDAGNILPHHTAEGAEESAPPSHDVRQNRGHVEERGAEDSSSTCGSFRTEVRKNVPTISSRRPQEKREAVAADVEESASSGDDSSSDVDGFDELEDLHPEAITVLEGLEHANPAGTRATLRVSFLYREGGGHPDPSVKGLPFTDRVDLVGRALLQMRDQGVRRWKTTALAAFIRPLREQLERNPTETYEPVWGPEADAAWAVRKQAERERAEREEGRGLRRLSVPGARRTPFPPPERSVAAPSNGTDGTEKRAAGGL